MQVARVLAVLTALMLLSAMVHADEVCNAPPLSDQQIKDIVDKERKARTDLPEPFPKYRWVVKRQGCYYAYIEYGLPEAPEYNQIFRLNPHGEIVDVQGGGKAMKCPEKVLTEADLAEIVAAERARRHDLPPPFPRSRTRVDRARCLYLYFEYALPEKRGDYQVFTIDPFGELMEFSRSQPY